MISIDIQGISLFTKLPSMNNRALEIAIDRTAIDSCKPAVYEEMLKVFDNPTRYTLNSLKVTPTRRHNMVAYVWFRDPDRMEQHYLVPQVDGGPRQLKGFERALGGQMYIPGRGATRTKAGNISIGQIRQILSVLGRAERTAGYQANITARSRKVSKVQRDYVYLPRGTGKRYAGVYKRKAKGAKAAATGTYRAGQRGRKRKVVRARGLVPVLIVGRQNKPYKARLGFYSIVNRVFFDNIGVNYVLALKRLAG